LVVFEVTETQKSMGDVDDSGALDLCDPWNRAVDDKAKQGRALEGRAPYVIVISAPRLPADPWLVKGGVFGRPTIPVPRSGDLDNLPVMFGRDAAVHPGTRDHVSAVAVLQRFHSPTIEHEQLPRLLVHHNWSASMPLGREVLGGVHDEQHFEVGGLHTLRAVGIKSSEVGYAW
jgi:hypothetical protein